MEITLDIDDEVVRKATEIAADKNTTLTAMVRDFLASLANSEISELDAAPGEEASERVRALWASIDNRLAATGDRTVGEEAAEKFLETVRRLSRPMGPRNWTRDDLYDRPYAYRKRE